MAEMTETIDFVICWVDGNDPVWQEEKRKYSPDRGQDGGIVRFRDWDNLQYWFRGVEKFAPWVNKIHSGLASQLLRVFCQLQTTCLYLSVGQA